MNPSSANNPRTNPQTVKPAGGRPVVLVLVFFLLGAALTGVWFKYGRPAAGPDTARLSGSTVELLRHLNSPVELRFYSVLPPGSAPEPLQAFSGRVDHLLSEFQGVSDGKISVTRNVSSTGANADAAAVDGIQPFNLDKGDACFLGLTVVCGDQKESLAEIKPEWEPALEFDLARAIQQVTTTPATSVAKAAAPVSPEITNAVIRLVPDLKDTSLEEGTRILREAAFEEFTAAGTEMEARVQAAQQQLSAAQNNGTGAEQQSAMKNLQELQLEQGERYKQIAARLQVELSVFQQMKAAASTPK